MEEVVNVFMSVVRWFLTIHMTGVSICVPISTDVDIVT